MEQNAARHDRRDDTGGTGRNRRTDHCTSILVTDLTTANRKASFEASTVAPNKTGTNRVMMRMAPGGVWDASNVTLESMIRLAYRLQEVQLVGGPAWIYSDRFDIQAQSAQGVAPAQFGERMQSLLTDRFNLKLHRETRELPIYALVVRNDVAAARR